MFNGTLSFSPTIGFSCSTTPRTSTPTTDTGTDSITPCLSVFRELTATKLRVYCRKLSGTCVFVASTLQCTTVNHHIPYMKLPISTNNSNIIGEFVLKARPTQHKIIFNSYIPVHMKHKTPCKFWKPTNIKTRKKNTFPQSCSTHLVSYTVQYVPHANLTIYRYTQNTTLCL